METLFGRSPIRTDAPQDEDHTAPWRVREEQIEQQVIDRLNRIRESLALIERRKDGYHD